VLRGFTGLTSIAIATTLNIKETPYYALELLKLGRGIISSLLLETCIDISALKYQNRKLAEEFVSLRDALDPLPTK